MRGWESGSLVPSLLMDPETGDHLNIQSFMKGKYSRIFIKSNATSQVDSIRASPKTHRLGFLVFVFI